MLWFFERNNESLKIETRYDNDTFEYVVIVRYPDGRQQTERFTESEACGRWLKTFEGNLEHEQWALRPGGPAILSDGWPNKRAT